MVCTVLNTRPAHQAKALDELLAVKGYASLSCPTIEIEWLTEASQFVENELLENDAVVNKVIFISANAVTGLMKQLDFKLLQAQLERASCYAIGKATCEKGLALGLEIETLSESQFDSENFLAHPEMNAVQGQTVLLVKGQQGRSLIESTLQARGAKVITLEVYQRVAAPFCKSSWESFAAAEHPVLLLTSLESWHKLVERIHEQQPLENSQMTLTGNPLADWLQSPVWSAITVTVVMSQRIADSMISQGWTRPVEVVTTQDNSGIVKTIHKYCSNLEHV